MPTISPTSGDNSAALLNPYNTQQNSSSVMGQDQFLTMLVAQLTYQDPMNPIESQQFSAQLAQFSSLEQLIDINANLEASLENQIILSQSISNTLAAGLLGNEAKALNDMVKLEDGQATPIQYELLGNADSVNIEIFDSQGNLVFTENLGAQSMGDQEFSWNGLNSAGVALPDGDYTYTVAAQTSNGQDIAVEQYLEGLITGVSYQSGQAYLNIWGLQVSLGDVMELNIPSGG